MTNYHAIATVTATLRDILFENLNIPQFAGIKITSKPLDVLETEGPELRLNLFLYKVTPNRGFQDVELPVRNTNGELVRSPLLPINLHYLVTSFNNDTDELQEIKSQQILSKAMMILNENSILSREKILVTRMNSPKIPDKDLDDHLETQVELVKITPESMSLEEITKLWSSFFQIHYRLSVSYLATLILLDSKKEPKISPPVQERKLYVLPLTKPTIEKIDPQIVESRPDSHITIFGQNLMAENVEILFGNVTVKPSTSDVFSDRIRVILPSQLETGIKSVIVAHPLTVVEPPTKHGNWNTSNVAAFVLSPTITDPVGINTITRGSSLTITVEPGVTHQQKVLVLLGEHQFEVKLPKPEDAVYPIHVLPALTVPTDFPLESAPQRFLLRIRIDGADSFVRFDNDPSSPTFEQYVPAIDIT
jgi:hypothetical protein